jgi:hypothetical protein
MDDDAFHFTGPEERSHASENRTPCFRSGAGLLEPPGNRSVDSFRVGGDDGSLFRKGDSVFLLLARDTDVSKKLFFVKVLLGRPST